MFPNKHHKQLCADSDNKLAEETITYDVYTTKVAITSHAKLCQVKDASRGSCARCLYSCKFAYYSTNADTDGGFCCT